MYIKSSELTPTKDGDYNGWCEGLPCLLRVKDGVLVRISFPNGGCYSHALKTKTYEWIAPPEGNQTPKTAKEVLLEHITIQDSFEDGAWYAVPIKRPTLEEALITAMFEFKYSAETFTVESQPFMALSGLIRSGFLMAMIDFQQWASELSYEVRPEDLIAKIRAMMTEEKERLINRKDLRAEFFGVLNQRSELQKKHDAWEALVAQFGTYSAEEFAEKVRDVLSKNESGQAEAVVDEIILPLKVAVQQYWGLLTQKHEDIRRLTQALAERTA